MELRNYQARTLQEVSEALTQHSSVLVAAPTGAGKGTMAVEIARECISKGLKVLFLVHRVEILEDFQERCDQSGVDGVVSITVQSLITKSKLPPADLILMDECHHYLADVWGGILDSYKNAKLIGFSATPWRADGLPLCHLFEKVVVSAPYSELIADGMLVPCQVIRPDHYLGRDLAQSSVDAYKQHGVGSTLVFCLNKSEAARDLQQFRMAGIQAEMVTDDTSPAMRKTWMHQFKTGHLKVLINVYIATEGVDVPRCQTIILARSCGHLSTYMQICGRALRPYPGKQWARVIDLTGCSHIHGLPTQDRNYTIVGGVAYSDRDSGVQGTGGNSNVIPAPQILGVSLTSYGFEPTTSSVAELPIETEMTPIRRPAWRTKKPKFESQVSDSPLVAFLRGVDWDLGNKEILALCKEAGLETIIDQIRGLRPRLDPDHERRMEKVKLFAVLKHHEHLRSTSGV